MSVVVVDASALAAVVFLEPEAKDVLPRLQDRTLVAPHLCAYEVTNTASKKLRAHPGSARAIREGLAVALGEEFAIYWSDVDALEVVKSVPVGPYPWGVTVKD